MQSSATPLFIASQSGHLGVVCLFSDAGADTDIAYQGDATPLLVAPGTDNLEVSTFRCDEQGGGILHCDALVGASIREPTNHLLAPLLGCDEQGGGATLLCDVLVGTSIREQTNHLEVSILRCDEQGGCTTLQCDVLVGASIREQTDHRLAPLLGCDQQGDGTLRCDVLVGPCTRTTKTTKTTRL